MNAGIISVYQGDYDSYLYHKALTSAGPEAGETCPPQVKKPVVPVPGGRQKRALSGELRSEYYEKSTPLKKRIDKIEKELSSAETEIKELESRFAQPEHYKDSKEVVGSIERHRELKVQAEELTETWGEVSSEADRLRVEFEAALGRIEWEDG